MMYECKFFIDVRVYLKETYMKPILSFTIENYGIVNPSSTSNSKEKLYINVGLEMLSLNFESCKTFRLFKFTDN